MGIGKRFISIMLPVCCMMMLILDSQTAIRGAAEAISLCLNCVIPSLFPFFVLSILLTSAILNTANPHNRSNGLFRQPANTLFIAGLLGGYPTGSQAVAEAYRNGHLSKNTAHRLLGFCSNAGPAFIFGMTAQFFSARYIPWLLWFIHILSALIVRVIIPTQVEEPNLLKPGGRVTLQQAFSRSLYTTASVCGWITLFRVLISFLERWFLWFLPQTAGFMISGILELTNGIILLQNEQSEALRFICCSILIAFGGCCVWMQTISVTKDLGTGWYFPGKLMQSAISGILSVITVRIIYNYELNQTIQLILIAGTAFFVILALVYRKKPIAFFEKYVYNGQKSSREFLPCSFEKR